MSMLLALLLAADAGVAEPPVDPLDGGLGPAIFVCAGEVSSVPRGPSPPVPGLDLRFERSAREEAWARGHGTFAWWYRPGSGFGEVAPVVEAHRRLGEFFWVDLRVAARLTVPNPSWVSPWPGTTLVSADQGSAMSLGFLPGGATGSLLVTLFPVSPEHLSTTSDWTNGWAFVRDRRYSGELLWPALEVSWRSLDWSAWVAATYANAYIYTERGLLPAVLGGAALNLPAGLLAEARASYFDWGLLEIPSKELEHIGIGGAALRLSWRRQGGIRPVTTPGWATRDPQRFERLLGPEQVTGAGAAELDLETGWVARQYAAPGWISTGPSSWRRDMRWRQGVFADVQARVRLGAWLLHGRFSLRSAQTYPESSPLDSSSPDPGLGPFGTTAAVGFEFGRWRGLTPGLSVHSALPPCRWTIASLPANTYCMPGHGEPAFTPFSDNTVDETAFASASLRFSPKENVTVLATLDTSLAGLWSGPTLGFPPLAPAEREWTRFFLAVQAR